MAAALLARNAADANANARERAACKLFLAHGLVRLPAGENADAVSVLCAKQDPS
jgi:uncharacterized MAPEG superfamily protein